MHLDSLSHEINLSPKGSADKPLKALLFDSWFDAHKGVVCLVKIIDGEMKKGTASCHNALHPLSKLLRR